MTKEKEKLKNLIGSARNKTKRRKLFRERQEVCKKIKQRIKELENKKLENKLNKLDQIKSESKKYYKVIKAISKEKKDANIIIKDKEGNYIGSNDEKIKLISEYFEDIFQSNKSTDQSESVKNHQLKEEFTEEEIRKAAKSLNDNKSAGIDNIHAEHIKYAPDVIHKEIAEIFNEAAKTGKFPTELKQGILIPLQKPGKRKGPIENLRPVVLLSILRKILAICLINRYWNK